VHLGQDQQVGTFEIAPQLRTVGGLAHQVQFVVQVLVELRHHFPRLESPAIGPEGFQQVGGDLQQRNVMLDHRLDAGAQDLDRDLAAIRQHREMHLRHRRRGNRRPVEGGEDLVHRLAIGLFELGDGQFRRKGRHAVLQLRQLVGDVQRQQVASGRQQLAELDEDRPQVFQGLAQAHGARGRQVAPEHQALRRKQQARAHARFDLVFEDQAVESVEVRDAGNTDQAEDAHGGWRRTWNQWGPTPALSALSMAMVSKMKNFSAGQRRFHRRQAQQPQVKREV
jgi:hypothetical protein